MRFLFIAFIVLLISGCDRGLDIGDCVELTDDSGRYGIYEEFHRLYLIRMKDKGTITRQFGYEIIPVDNKYCEE